MSLDFFAEPMDRIRQFLQSRELTVLIIRHEPDLDQIVQKFLVALDQDEKNPAVLVGVQAAYHDRVSFSVDVLRDLVEQNEAQRQSLAAMGIQLPRPGVPSGAGGPADDAAAVLSAYISDVADGLPDWVGAYRVVLRPKEITDVTGFRDFVRFLAESTRSEWAKYLVSDRRVEPLLDGLPKECARVSVQNFALSPEEIERRIQAELAGGKLRYCGSAGKKEWHRKRRRPCTTSETRTSRVIATSKPRKRWPAPCRSPQRRICTRWRAWR